MYKYSFCYKPIFILPLSENAILIDVGAVYIDDENPQLWYYITLTIFTRV